MQKKNKNERLEGKEVAVALFLFGLVLFFLWYSEMPEKLTGFVGVENAVIVKDSAYCEDSDKGIDFNIRGELTYKNPKKEDISKQMNDSCDVSGSTLTEYYCKGASYTILKRVCKNGCVDGACIRDDAVEKCYLKFEINETKEADKTLLELNSMTSIYGSYGKFVEIYNPVENPDFIFNAKDKMRKTVGRYSSDSSRFSLWDAFSGEQAKGGIEEVEKGILTLIVPFNGEISSFGIVESAVGKITNVKLPRTPTCKRTCKLENEGGKWGEIECCAGLQSVQKVGDYTGFVCVKCGDGICSANEDVYSCSEDCKNS